MKIIENRRAAKIASDRAIERQKELAKYKADLESKKAPTEADKLKLAKAKVDLKKAQADLALKQNPSITPAQSLALDDREKDELASISASFIDKNGNEKNIPFETRAANALQANNRPNNKVYYIVQEPKEIPGLFNDFPGDVTPVFLPKNPKTGKQITSQDVIDTARSLNISENEVLQRIGAVVPVENK